MRETKIERTARFFNRMSDLGFTYSEAQSLRRIEMTLQRWSEHECNGEIERDETTGKPYSISRAYINGSGDYKRWPTADREKGALDRLKRIMAKHPELWSYHQTDPRGCQLYVGQQCIMTTLEMEQLDRYYSKGLAVCI